MGEFTVYEIAGHATWVKLRDLLKQETAPEVREPRQPRQYGAQHQFKECTTTTDCPYHGEQFRNSPPEFVDQHLRALAEATAVINNSLG